MELFCEISNALVQVRNQKFFRARVFVKLGHFDKDFVKGTGKKAPQGNILEIVLLMNGKFNPKMDTIRAFLSKIRTLNMVAKYASISLNMSKYT